MQGEVLAVADNLMTCLIPSTDPGPGDFKGNNTDQGYPLVHVSNTMIQRHPLRTEMILVSFSNVFPKH